MAVDFNFAEMEQAQRAIDIDLQPIWIEVESKLATNLNNFRDDEFAAQHKFETRARRKIDRLNVQGSIGVAHKPAGCGVDPERFDMPYLVGSIDFQKEFAVDLQTRDAVGSKREINTTRYTLAIYHQINRARKRAEE